MAVEVLFPKVDMDADTGRISRWLVKNGNPVQEGDVLFEIESEKAAIEVEAPSSGILAHTAVGSDGVIKVGQAVALICSDPEYHRLAAAASVGRVEGANGTISAIGSGQGPATMISAIADPATPGKRQRFSTPLARRLASEAGIELSAISGSGPRGRIQKRDILAARPAHAAHEAEQQVPKPRAVLVAAPAALNAAWLKQAGEGTVVLLHGFGSDLNIWRATLGGAPFEGNVLAIDLPGHGQSPRAIPNTLDELAEQVEQTVSAQNIGRVMLAGHSFGAAVAARIASRGVIDVRSLLMFAPAGLGPQINASFLRGFLEAKSQASIVPWLNELVSDSEVISPSFVSTVERQASDLGLRAAQRTLQERFFPDGTQAFSIRTDLATLTIPARVVIGTQDRILPSSYVQRLPGSVSVNSFSACGHMPQLECRADCLRILKEMLRHV